MNQTMLRWLGGWMGGLLLGSTAMAAAGEVGKVKLDNQLAAIVGDVRQPLASLSVLAIRRGQPVYQQQFGDRYLPAQGGQSLPVTADTLFRIASVSKMMTTLALMRLVEQNKLQLDQDVGIYLGFSLRNPYFPTQAITLRSLLSHTSSLRDAAGYSWGAERSLRDVFTAGGDAMWANNAAPGRYFSYANLNWGVIGTVMEKVTGERFDRLMRRLLLAPMGLRGGYNPAEFSPGELNDMATLYRKRPADSETWNPDGPWIAQADDVHVQAPVQPAGLDNYVIGSNATLFSPTGGLRISAADMGKVMQMLLAGGRYRGQQLLQPASIALMFTKQWQLAADGGNGDSDQGLFRAWGLGNQQFDADGARGNGLVAEARFSAAGHLGDAYGLRSAFVLDFANRNGMIYLIGGTGSDPDQQRGPHTALSRPEEAVLDALYHGAIVNLD
ncbi:serine hydrolase domain-containing protein [Janthinobacterium sp. J1-1]|uniref:serine hydrolase domain-containing protein n=1 Tax=Janthinobacterium sp. J1-1 TaxID=3065910 RepID=UPI0028119DB8|nr:serine hydrolase domain-containing protein [Janthinobacterium sp. J1-1]